MSQYEFIKYCGSSALVSTVFVIFKITNTLDWSWFLVFSPTWTSVLVIITILMISLVFKYYILIQTYIQFDSSIKTNPVFERESINVKLKSILKKSNPV
jgi:hypothetical protein